MARLSNASASVPRTTSSYDRTSSELGQLLLRLQQTVLHADAERERRLRTSEYERTRINANLDFARKTLTKLEHDALGMLAPGRRAEAQSDLNRKREVLELLLDKLQDAEKMAIEEDDDDSSEGEDLLAEIIPTPSESMDSTASVDIPPSRTNLDESQPSPIPEPAAQPEPTQRANDLSPDYPPQDAPTQISQSLRARGGASSPSPSIQSHSTARAALFAGRRKPSSTVQSQTSLATTEALLDRQAAEREDIADKVYRMASAMKKQQQDIASALDSEKDILGRTTETMEKSAGGMQLATGRLGTFTRMTEGKGWWGRIILYAWVYGLMVGLVLLVFVLPKLRF